MGIGATGVKIRGEGVVTLNLSPASVFFYRVYFIHSTSDDIKLILILIYFTLSIYYIYNEKQNPIEQYTFP